MMQLSVEIRSWMGFLTILGVRVPETSHKQEFQGCCKKIVIDDFDESTQLAVLINKPILDMIL